MTGEPPDRIRDIDPTDREALRAWMERHHSCTTRPHCSNAQEFMLLQRMRLLQSLTTEEEH